MKKIKLIFIYCFFFCTNFFGQSNYNGKITYAIKINSSIVSKYKKSESRKQMDKRTRSYLDKMYSNTTIEEGILIFKNDESLFRLTNKMRNEANGSFNMVKGEAGGKNKFYKNNKTNENLEQDCEILGKCYLINNPVYVWEITQETKKIGQYVCYKAISTSVFKERKTITTAWFTTEIPVNFGPKYFNGLPGLIIELQRGSLIYVANKIELNLKSIKNIKKPKKGEKVTKKEFRKLFGSSFTNFK